MGCWLKANKVERLSQRGKETGMAGKKSLVLNTLWPN